MVQSLYCKDPLEKEIEPTPVFLPRKSHGVWWGTIHRVKRVGHDWVHTPFHAQLIYNYVLVCVSFKCAARTSAIYTFFFRFFSLIGYYNILSRVSCAIHRSWLGIYYISVSAPWRRAWQPTPVFLPGEAPWTEDPGGLYILHWIAQSQTTTCAYAHNVILLINTKLWTSTNTCNFKCILLSAKIQTQKATYILYDSINMTLWKGKNFRERKHIRVVARDWV